MFYDQFVVVFVVLLSPTLTVLIPIYYEKNTHPDGANGRLGHDVWETNSVIFKKANKSRVCDFREYNFKYLRIPTRAIFFLESARM